MGSAYLSSYISAAVAFLLTYCLFALPSRWRFVVYGIPITRTIMFYLLCADASRNDWHLQRFRGFLYCRLLASGLAQDLPAWWAYLRPLPRSLSCGAVFCSQWVFPFVVMFPLLNFAAYTANAYALEQNTGYLIGGALAGTCINMLFFFYAVRLKTMADAKSPLHYSQLVVSSERIKRASCCNRWAVPLIPSLFTAAYIVSIGTTLEKNGVALSVAISVIPVTSFFAIPVSRVLQCAPCHRGYDTAESLRENSISARRKALSIYIAITFNNTISSWLMLLLSYIPPQGPWMWSLPAITLCVCVGCTISIYKFLYRDNKHEDLMTLVIAHGKSATHETQSLTVRS